jgi:RHS repeat-associated protein
VADHLGSIAVVTDSAGTVSERDSYDAWGRRRNANGTDNSACAITSATTRGFTGHEMLDSDCEINANARIYDPTLGRFMSPDSVVQAPFNGQSFNRYSYVFNNPLAGTDPSGYDDTMTDPDLSPPDPPTPDTDPDPDPETESGKTGDPGQQDGGDVIQCNRACWTALTAAQARSAFFQYIRSQGGWSGPYWDARAASGLDTPFGAMASTIFAGLGILNFGEQDLLGFEEGTVQKASQNKLHRTRPQ